MHYPNSNYLMLLPRGFLLAYKSHYYDFYFFIPITPSVTIVSQSRVRKTDIEIFWTHTMAFQRKVEIAYPTTTKNVDMVYAMKDGWFTNVSPYNYA